jgi:hypothetical protein
MTGMDAPTRNGPMSVRLRLISAFVALAAGAAAVVVALLLLQTTIGF